MKIISHHLLRYYCVLGIVPDREFQKQDTVCSFTDLKL